VEHPVSIRAQPAAKVHARSRLVPPTALDALTAKLRALEARWASRIGVSLSARHHGECFLVGALGILRRVAARSREDIRAVNTASADHRTPPADPARLILLILPECLPVDPVTAWNDWDPRGRAFKIAGDARKLSELLFHGQPPGPASANCWRRNPARQALTCGLIDAGSARSAACRRGATRPLFP